MKLEEYIDEMTACGLLYDQDKYRFSIFSLSDMISVLKIAENDFLSNNDTALIEVIHELKEKLINIYKYSVMYVRDGMITIFDAKVAINIYWESKMSEPYGIDCYVDVRG